MVSPLGRTEPALQIVQPGEEPRVVIERPARRTVRHAYLYPQAALP